MPCLPRASRTGGTGAPDDERLATRDLDAELLDGPRRRRLLGDVQCRIRHVPDLENHEDSGDPDTNHHRRQEFRDDDRVCIGWWRLVRSGALAGGEAYWPDGVTAHDRTVILAVQPRRNHAIPAVEHVHPIQRRG